MIAVSIFIGYVIILAIVLYRHRHDQIFWSKKEHEQVQKQLLEDLRYLHSQPFSSARIHASKEPPTNE